jgi:hypothetical protein
MASTKVKVRKHLSADALFKTVKRGFKRISDHRKTKAAISLADALMSGFAMFSLKDPSLLAFDERRTTDKNLKTVYKIDQVPCDTQMRTILDDVSSADIYPLFKDVFRPLQRGKELEQMLFMGKYYLVSLDGTGYFSSNEIYCESCLKKEHKKSGKVSYHHQMLGAAIVHPDVSAVIPLAPEPIIKQDGECKNDCERNAAKRFLKRLRQDHPQLPLIIIEDALSSNAPHIRELKRHNCHFILGVKEGDHPYLFNYVHSAHTSGKVSEYEIEKEGVIHRFRYLNEVPLNASNSDLLVNFVEYWEIKGEKVRRFCWITDFTVSDDIAHEIMRGGRARWKIENETFNTLKNQGYHFEHNFGHGKKNLSVVFALLMMLAFLVDQVQQLSCALFKATWKKYRTKRSLWEKMRWLFQGLEFDSMEHLFRALLYGYRIEGFQILEDSS